MENPYDQFDPTSTAKDVAIGFSSGANQLLKMAGDAFGFVGGGMDNIISQQAKENLEYLQRQKSPELRQAEAARQAAMDAKDTTLGRAATYVKETWTNPLLTMTQAAEAVPSFIVSGGAGAVAKGAASKLLAKGAETATKIGVGTAIATGAGMQGLGVAGDQYGALVDTLTKMPEENAKQIPQIRYLMETEGLSLDQAKTALAMDLALSTGILATVASVGTQVVPGGATIERALVEGTGKAAAKGFVPRLIGAGKGAIGESTQESAEGTSGRMITNVMATRVEPERPLMQGVGEEIGSAITGVAPLGAAGGAIYAQPTVSPRPVPASQVEAGISDETPAPAATRTSVGPAPTPNLERSEEMSPEQFFAAVNVRHARVLGGEPNPEDVRLVGEVPTPTREVDAETVNKALQSGYEALNAWKQNNPNAPENIVLIYDPEMLHNGYGVQGAFNSKNGAIFINTAFVTPENVGKIVNHEWAHATLASPEGQRAFLEFAKRQIPKEELDALAVRYRTQNRLVLLEEWIAENQEKAPGVISRIVAQIREWLSNFGIVNLNDREVADIMLRTLREQAEGKVQPDIDRVSGGAKPTVETEVSGGMEAAPAKMALEEKPAEQYRGSHVAPTREAAAAHDLTSNGIYPKDVYQRPDWYETGEGLNQLRRVLALKDKPDAKVYIYRAVPTSVYEEAMAVSEKTGTPFLDLAIRPGDWVTISKQYANDHGESALQGDFKVVAKQVPASEIFTNGDSIMEWGYQPSKPVEIRYSLTPEQQTAIDNKTVSELDIPKLVSEGILTERYATLLENLRKTSGDAGETKIEIWGPAGMPARAAGVYRGADNVIMISSGTKLDLGRVLLHEYVHALTIIGLKYAEGVYTTSGDMILAKPRYGVDSKELRDASRDMYKLLAEARKAAAETKQEFYGFTNREEFVAEAFSNEKFQQFLSSIPSIRNKKQSLFDEFISIVKRILGLSEDSLLTDVITATDPLIGATRERVGTLVSDDFELPEGSRFSLAQTKTPEFKSWFGNSEVVDENGNPRVMYHGAAFRTLLDEEGRLSDTPDFTAFKPNERGLIFVSPDPKFASKFAERYAGVGGGYGEGARVYPTFVKAENPFDYENPAHVQKLFGDKNRLDTPDLTDGFATRGQVLDGSYSAIEALTPQIKEAGFDGLYVSEGDSKNLAVFDPDQLKSATGNIGAFGQRPVTAEEAERMGMTEEEATKAQAEGDLRFSLAQTKTPEFKAWFGDWEGDPKNASKVVDEKGNPLIVKHGTKEDFNVFDMNRKGNPFRPASGGAWFAESDEIPKKFSGNEGRVMETYLNVRKPFELPKEFDLNSDTTPSKFESAVNKILGTGKGDRVSARELNLPDRANYIFGVWQLVGYNGKLVEALKKRGYDGIKAYEDGFTTWKVFEPTQIKSATSNVGAFGQRPVTAEEAERMGMTEEEAAEAQKRGDIRMSLTQRVAKGRDVELAEAAQKLKRGEITAAKYNKMVDERLPLKPFEEVPEPASDEDILRGLGERMAGQTRKKDLKANPEDIEGQPVEARLDIPSYEDEGVWTVTLHTPREKAGSAGKVLAYTPTAVLRDVVFNVNETAAMNVAAGTPKSSFATMDGTYVPMTANRAYNTAVEAKDSGDWVEVGMNPIRHSYFYDKADQRPVVSADEVIQVGGLVLARGVEYGEKGDFRYSLSPKTVQKRQMEQTTVKGPLQADSKGFIPVAITEAGALPTVVIGKNKTVEVPFVSFNQYANTKFISRSKDPEFSGREITLADAHIPLIQKDYLGLRPRTYAETDIQKATNMVVDDMSSNLLFLHDLASELFGPEVVKRMSKWYDGANVIAGKFADKYGISINQSAAMLAAFSPQKHWFANVSLAENVMDILKNHQNTVFDEGVEKAAREAISRSSGTDDSKQKLEGLIGQIRGKKLSEIGDIREAAVFVRFLSQAIHPQQAYIVTPEGELTPGSSVAVAWSGTGTTVNAIRAYLDGSVEILTQAIGGGHKVRNFFGNIIDPMSPLFYTSDTHNVAAALLIPVGGSDFEVSHNFGTNPSPASEEEGGELVLAKDVEKLPKLPVVGTTITGLQGTYPLYVEAGRRAANERGILPRQMQSITWEMIRILFTDDMKTAQLMEDVKKVHDRVRRGTISVPVGRQKILELAGGKDSIKARPPEWLNK